MGDRCASCVHFSSHDTELPVCRLHRRYMHEDWSCADFEGRYETTAGDGGSRDGKAQEAED